MNDPTPLDYHAPVADGDFRFNWRDNRVEIELGPMPPSMRIGLSFALGSRFALVILLATAVVWKSLDSAWPFPALVASICAARFMASTRRAKRTMRRVWASPEVVGHSDSFHPSGAQVIEPTKYRPVKIYRCWFAPWAFRLILSSKFLHSKRPVILLHHDNRAQLESIAELVETARNAVVDAGHVRGAFEVLPVQRPEASHVQ